MGNCCGKKPSPPPPRKTPEAPPAPSLLNLQIVCSEPNFVLQLRTKADVPMSEIKDQVLEARPELAAGLLLVYKGQAQVLDDTCTLKQLQIETGDTLRVEIQRPRKEEAKHVSMYSMEEIAEEEGTDKHEIVSILPNQAMNSGRNKVEFAQPEAFSGSAPQIWRGLRSPVPSHFVRIEEMEISSTTNNTHDISVKDHFPQNPNLQLHVRLNEQSVMSDQDESYAVDDPNDRRLARFHPSGFFRDLQGPFSAINRM